MSLCGLFFGAFGLLLYFMSLFTEHDYTYNNMNMIFCTPVILAAFPLGICYALTKKPEKQLKYDMILRCIWLLSVIGVIVSMLLKLLPWFWQDNLTDQLLMLPIALVFALRPYGLKEIANKYLPFLRREK
jgi:drug/metabolite transporter (DMT)-like permease